MDRQDEIRTALAAALHETDGERSPLDLIEEIPLLEAAVEDLVSYRIEAARGQGLSWAAIALRLGTTRQAAHKRFGKDTAKRRGTRIELRFERAKSKK